MCLDSGALSRLTSRDHGPAYQAALGDKRIAISFQVKPELLAFPMGDSRRDRLNILVAASLELPHTEATNVWYARVAGKRADLQKVHHDGGNAGDGDVWIISSALEHRLPFMSHDGPCVELARAMGLPVFTDLPDLSAGNPHDWPGDALSGSQPTPAE